MTETSTALENGKTHGNHPSKETFKHLRHQIKERMPETKRRVFDKSGTTPTPRELINAAGDMLRHEMESDYDVLTGLPNKRGYEKQTKKAIAKAKADNTPTAIAIVDLDGLKATNDILGHTAGDWYLKNAAKALLAASRGTDIPARVGGDEFQVLLINTTPDLAEAWKIRVIEEMENRAVKASIGIAPVDLNNINDSIRKADGKMYEEKRHRKQKIEVKTQP